MSDLVLASSNPGKVTEIQRILANSNIRVRPQSAFGVSDAIENGLTFVENAIIKARHASHCTGLPALADDSGIEVDYLNGQPGIYSARYAGEHASNEANNNKLLAELEGVEQSLRTARFQCLIVYLRHAADPTPLICQGTWEGFIANAPCGKQGFGYDPLFFLPDYGCTSAELAPALKNQISHRALALHKLLECLGKETHA
ncbi:MAG TPA: RdgB/HAM1 family non-canonical purine NTP pyrophosphatase [Gammaproteobacteria bacterium]|nr:RdgB/HAM1 family non-canonical purine NTP pyrophosphatase [Gammaproteobacteria bacterium]